MPPAIGEPAQNRPYDRQLLSSGHEREYYEGEIHRHRQGTALIDAADPLWKAPVMRLYSITAIVEAEDDDDAEAVTDAIEKAICPYPVDAPDHACPRGWITMRHELDDEEATSWREPDALNR